MKKTVYRNWLVYLVAVFILSSCATTKIKEPECDANVIAANGRPCWVNKTPQKGIVVNMSQHIRPEETRGELFKKAVVELAVTQDGLSVSQDAVVNKVTQVHNDNVRGHSSVTSVAVLTTTNESVVVKAKIKDSWLDVATQKLYMWVVLSQ